MSVFFPTNYVTSDKDLGKVKLPPQSLGLPMSVLFPTSYVTSDKELGKVFHPS